MTPAELLDAIERLLPFDRERIATAVVGEVPVVVLLAELDDRCYSVDDADEVVAFCRRIIAEIDGADDDDAGLHEATARPTP